jgi:hypothetical protein
MCCSCEKKTLSIWGKILSFIFLAGAIVCILLVGINYKLSNTNFSNQGGNTFSAILIGSTIVVIFVCFLGIFTFWCDHWCLTTLVKRF